MNLYLSRLCLNPLFAPALRLAADPYELHRKLLDSLPCRPRPKPASGNQPKTAELLFRVDATDAGPVVLIQTGAEPDWEALELPPRALRCPPETKAYVPKFTPGVRLAFCLLCQPVVRRSGHFGFKPNRKRKDGPRRACCDDEQRLQWLHRKANRSGFAIESVGLSVMEWRNTKPLQGNGGTAVETYDQARRRAASQRLIAVRFDGVLVVMNPDVFSNSIALGVGTAKAFGFGLLSVARAD